MDTEKIKALQDEVKRLKDEEHKVFLVLLDNWQAPAQDPAVLAAQDHASRVRKAADEDYEARTADARATIDRVEKEAEAARQSVLARHEATLTACRRTVKEAKQAVKEAVDAAQEAVDAARRAFELCRHEAHGEIAARRRKAEVALALAALGSPAVCPIELHYGSRRWVQVDGDGYHLTYRLHNARRDELPDASVSLTVLTEPDVIDQMPRFILELSTKKVDGATLREAVRNAEDAAIAEGWLRRDDRAASE